MPNPRPARFAVPLPATTLRIRRAITADHAGLVALENETFSSDRLSPRQWARHLDSDSARVLVAIAERELVGAAVLFFRVRSPVARLYSLAIGRRARGRGIGSALLEAAEQHARRKGCTRLRLEVRRDNKTARRLYERRGYRAIGTLARYYEDAEDAVRYERTLPLD